MKNLLVEAFHLFSHLKAVTNIVLHKSGKPTYYLNA